MTASAAPASTPGPSSGLPAGTPPAPAPGLPSGHTPRLRYRILQAGDLAECMELLPPHLGLPPNLRDALPGLWQRLVAEPAVITGVMEDTALPAGQRIQAWGVTIALPDAWVQRESLHQAPRVGVGRRVYEGLLSGALPLPNDRDIGAANARGELDLLILHFSMRRTDLQDPYVHKVVAIANDTFRAFHDGYFLRAICYETNVLGGAFAQASGFDPVPFADGDTVAHLPPIEQPVFYALTREQARRRLPGTPARNSFEHQPPRFRFNAPQRRLLWHALFDDSDDTLMASLDVSTHGLKKLWRGIYERVADVEPLFFGDGGSGDDEGKRGPEKRRQVLAYVRQRPEELRPWAPSGR